MTDSLKTKDKIARPKHVWVDAVMPKTRSRTIMRGVIAGISHFADLGGVSTLANPEIVQPTAHAERAALPAGLRAPSRREGQANGGIREAIPGPAGAAAEAPSGLTG